MTQQNKIILVSVVVALMALAALVFFTANKGVGNQELASADQSDDTTNQAQPTDATNGEAAGERAFSADDDPLTTPNPLGEVMLGAANAPVTIIEYSSLTCPHCAAFHAETLPLLKTQYIDKGLVKILFRPFPFDPYATAGAMLVQCVADHQRVTFLDILFQRQSTWMSAQDPTAALQAIARQAGLSDDDFVVCLKDQKIFKGVRMMQKAATEQLGVRSTPTFFINGKKLEGNHPIADFEKILKPLVADN